MYVTIIIIVFYNLEQPGLLPHREVNSENPLLELLTLTFFSLIALSSFPVQIKWFKVALLKLCGPESIQECRAHVFLVSVFWPPKFYGCESISFKASLSDTKWLYIYDKWDVRFGSSISSFEVN